MMKKRLRFVNFLPVYLAVFGGCILIAVFSSRVVTVMAESAPLSDRTCIVIDAGHGGEDGGAVSCTGIYESAINLEIALRLNDLLRFLGYDTRMIRTEDVSMHSQGNTIAAHKVSDLKNRTDLVNQTENALLVSIHQNTFQESQYQGAQVFYASTEKSRELADTIQAGFKNTLNPGSKRGAKKASGIYLLDNIHCTGVLVECGFLSNPEEEAKLREGEYQQKICCVLCAALAQFIQS